ncbi:phenylalanine--tRNA ligase subunit beta [Oceanispirochaeta sp.]|jgi:phenylalanyl-tRNA synthetase beta chain|uniref:phenylalanine--tRNA ligase subunit beta n=1 Tax=Oceanispirochaeta sp. TaxID=2035350 RepID=UPI00261BA28D|nr:phenylalanine--tRNA ligase subunit beta [Oceanispirochaeta sp.]MDA3956441.1 phenylalanine--tRNA ligase subunit beta [Oceanispirochaeta sp.]
MYISIDWIKDFVDLPEMNQEKLAQRFTMATCEVEDVLTTGELLERVRIVEITQVEDHPDSDHLHLVRFTDGKEEHQVVCGAPNAVVGKRVPYAPQGTTFPGGFTLTPKKIRGVVSEGMLCSETELVLGDDDSGLKIFPDDAPLGQSVGEYIGQKNDILFDIDNKSITHRPDLWGHYGMAREFAAVFGSPLKDLWNDGWEQNIRSWMSDENPPVSITVDPDSANLGFTGISMDNITIKDSPLWIQNRLNACGMRPINNIVDISNYVMLELGIPNHIFDRDTIRGEKIIVRRAGEDKEFVTLDEMTRELQPSDTMVCDAQGPSGIAGIMGGLDSSIADKTSRIFLEVANWKDSEVRSTATRLGLRTDALQRYEKSLDSQLLERSLLRLIELVKESCPEAVVKGSIVKVNMPVYTPLVIRVSPRRICQVLGKKIPTLEIVQILEALDFAVAQSERELTVTVPSYRSTKDIECDADIIEEIGRIIGYDNITPESPMNAISAVRLSEAKVKSRKIQDFMVNRAGALEIMTYPMVGEKLLDQAYWPEKNETLVLVNAMSPESDRMRPSLIPSLMASAALNQKSYSSFKMFELGRSYQEDVQDFSNERYQLGFVSFDKKNSPYLDVANRVEELMNSLNISYRMIPGKNDQNPLYPVDWAGIHPYETMDIQIMGRSRGYIGTIHPLVCRNFKIKGQLVIAVLDLTDFQDQRMKDKTKYQPLDRFPSSLFDCTVLAEAHTPVEDVVSALKTLKMKELDWVKVADVFVMSEEQKSVTLRMSFKDPDKTLTGDFIKEAEDKVIATLKSKGYPLKM